MNVFIFVTYACLSHLSDDGHETSRNFSVHAREGFCDIFLKWSKNRIDFVLWDRNNMPRVIASLFYKFPEHQLALF